MSRVSAYPIMLAILVVVATGCDRHKPIKVGFIASLTGKNADLGIAGRDAVQLAVENVNSGGGIKGRKLVLSVRDVEFNPENAAKCVESLAAEKVVAIIGPMGSSIAKAALPEATRNGIVMVSPTSSTNELSGKDDYFFRVMEPNRDFARHQADTSININVKRVAAIYDLQNPTYTVEMFRAFKEEFTRRGGVITAEISYDSSKSPAFMPLVEKLGLDKADGVMILANSVDSINIAQQVRKVKQQLPIISGACGIAQRDLLQQAGKSINNIIFTLPVNSQSRNPGYVTFRENFNRRFGYQPTYAAVLAYDAAQAVIAGLKKNPDPAQFRETMKGLGTFHGLQGDITLDGYGDINRKLYILRFTNGREEIVEQ